MVLSTAGAVHARMPGTAPTGLDELFAERGTGAVGAGAGIGGRDLLLPGEILERLLAKLNGTQQGGVLGLHALKDSSQARADLVPGFRSRRDGMFKLATPCFQRLVFRAATAIVVNDRVAQDAIEPADHGLALPQISLVLNRTHVGGLKDVLGHGGIGDPSLQEAEKLPALVENGAQ